VQKFFCTLQHKVFKPFCLCDNFFLPQTQKIIAGLYFKQQSSKAMNTFAAHRLNLRPTVTM